MFALAGLLGVVACCAFVVVLVIRACGGGTTQQSPPSRESNLLHDALEAARERSPIYLHGRAFFVVPEREYDALVEIAKNGATAWREGDEAPPVQDVRR